MDLGQGNVMQIEKIINKHVYFEKWSDVSMEQYEVKYKGQSYLSTRWMAKQLLDQKMVEQYERQFEKLTIRQESKRKDSYNLGSQDSKNDSSQNGKYLEVKNKQQNSNRQLTKNFKQQLLRPRLVREIKNMNQKNSFRLCINTPIKKQQNHYIYGDHVQEIISQIHKVFQKAQKNQQYLTNNNNNNGRSFLKHEEINKSFYKDRLVNKIQINLGNFFKKERNNQQATNPCSNRIRQQQQKRNMYVQMGQLKQMKALEEKGVFIRIFFKVKWTDGTESKVKMKYMNQYQKEMMEQYRLSRKYYWIDWNNKYKTLQSQNSNQNKKLEQIKYLQTPKTSKSQSESNYETSSSSIMEKGQNNQRKLKQMEGIILQKVRNTKRQNNQSQQKLIRIKTEKGDKEEKGQSRKQVTNNRENQNKTNDSKAQSYLSQKISSKIRQKSFAQRKQLQVTNSIRKQTKLTYLEQFQRLNSGINIKKEQTNNNSQQYNFKKQKQKLSNDQKSKINNNQSRQTTRWLDQIQSQQFVSLKDKQNYKVGKDKSSQNENNQHKILQQKTKTSSQNALEKKHKQSKTTIQQKQKNILSYFNSTKSSLIIDKPHFIARKSINQQALQQSKSRKLLKDYGIIPQKGQIQTIQHFREIRDDKVSKKSIIYNGQQQCKERYQQQSRRKTVVDKNDKSYLGVTMTKNESIKKIDKNHNNSSSQIKRQSFISRDLIASLAQKERNLLMKQVSNKIDDMRNKHQVGVNENNKDNNLENKSLSLSSPININHPVSFGITHTKSNNKNNSNNKSNNNNINKMTPKQIEVIQIDDD